MTGADMNNRINLRRVVLPFGIFRIILLYPCLYRIFVVILD